jgi:dTDP-4-amino-4,6-dideoxygalactose transaminase
MPDETRWPLIEPEDRARVHEVLDGGALVSDRNETTAVDILEQEWSEFVGADSCVGVANGTIALQIALAAVGVGPGTEVIVPALSFVATAMAVVNQGARPVFADVDGRSFNLDPHRLEELVTDRTAAIMPVHLHGLPARMDAILEIADRHGISVVEDAAQAHGATIRGRHVGTMGRVGVFSLQATKNLPTCGEGGLLVTDDATLDTLMRQLRQFGETIERGRPRQYVSHRIGWNAKLSSVQAAFASSQLRRLDSYTRARESTIGAFLDRLSELPGLVVPTSDADSTHVWHILRFRLRPHEAGLLDISAAAFRRAVQQLLRAEGVPVTRYQLMPLPDQPAFADLRDGAPSAHAWPDTVDILDDSLVLQRRHLDPSAGPLLQQYADAFEKVWDQLDVARALAARGQR